MLEATVTILVDYESELARRVAGDIWSGLSRAALGGGAGHARITASWDSLREPQGLDSSGGPSVRIFVVEQGLPEAIDAVVAPELGSSLLYGVVVAVPEAASPLSGPLLYQGVERLTAGGVRVGAVEPAVLHAVPQECESYAQRLIERLRSLQGRR